MVYALAWLSFGAGHSALSGAAAKRRLGPVLGPYYRLGFNLVSVLHIALVWTLGRAMMGDAPPYAAGPWAAPWATGALTVVTLAGWVLLVAALREYDLGRFSGLKQIRDHRRGVHEAEDESLVTAGLHRFVRHPLYLGAHLILWGGAGDDFGLATAVWGSVYLFVGARYEERKLLQLYGADYRDYRRRVPALIPWKGRAR